MLSDRLFVNDVEVELSPGTLIALNFQINDLADISNRNANFSQTFKIPKTVKNSVIFEQAGIVQSNTTLPYRKNRCRVNRRGIDIINEGVLIIEDVSDVYNCTVYSGNYNLAELLGDKVLADLNLKSYDVPNLLNNMYASRSHTYNDGTIYAVVDFNDDPAYMSATSQTFKATRSLPQIFCKFLFLRIFAEAGVNISGNFLTDPIFENLLLQLYNEKRGGLVYKTPIFAGGNYPDTQYPNGIAAYVRTSYFPPIDDLRQYSAQAFTGELTTHPEYKMILFTSTDEICFTAEFDFDAFNLTANPITFTFQIMSVNTGNYAGAAVIGQQQFTIGAGQTWARQKIVVKTNSGTNVTRGNNIYLRVSGLSLYNATTYNAKVNIYGGTLTGEMLNGYVPVINNTFGQYAIIKYGLPNIKQYDFVRAIMQIFGLFCNTDNVNNITTFKTLNEIKAAEFSAIDWSDKISLTPGSDKVTFRKGSYNQNNWLRYATDDAVYPPDLGDGTFVIDDLTLPLNNREPTDDLITLPFAPSQMVNRLGGTAAQKFVPLIKCWDGSGAFIKTTPRLLLLVREAAVAGEIKHITDGTTTKDYTDVLPLCKFISPVTGSTGNLGFGNDLLQTYYPELVNILNKFKMVTAKFKLTDADILNLDFFTPVYLKQYSAYFYINLVKNYTGEGLTEVELVRI